MSIRSRIVLCCLDLLIAVLPVMAGPYGRPVLSPASRAVSVADFNGDKVDDLVTQSPTGIVFHPGLKDGGFGPFVESPFSVLTGDDSLFGDFDHDGQLDLVLSTGTSSVVLLGDGKGRFNQVQDLDRRVVAVGDLNEDGFVDFVHVEGYNSKRIGFFLGQGDGTFVPGNEYDVQVSNVALTDFNRDRHLDVVTGDTGFGPDSLQVHLGRGDGTFDALAAVPLGDDAYGLEAADVDMDGNPDVVVAFGPGRVRALLGDGTGNLPTVRDSTVEDWYQDLRVAYLDNDAMPDLIGSGRRFLLGVGDGTFRETGQVSDGDIVALIDEDRDSNLDLVLAGLRGLAFRYGKGNGAFEVRENEVQSFPFGIATADFDGDGWIDVAATNTVFESGVSILLGRGDDSLEPSGFLTQQPGDRPFWIVADDLDRDGNADLVLTNQGSGTINVYVGLGTGEFSAPLVLDVGGPATVVLTEDFNQDNVVDLAVGTHFGGEVVLFLGRGDATFEPASRLDIGGNATVLDVADVDGDGHLDLVVSSFAQGFVSVWLGEGNGGFQPSVSIPTPAPVGIAVRDFDQDGWPDIAVGTLDQAVGIYLYPNDGTGGFGSPTMLETVLPSAYLIFADDIDGDGRVDLAAVTSGGNAGDVSVFLNGDEGFQSEQRYLGYYAKSMAFADMDRNGRADLVVTIEGPGGNGDAVQVILDELGRPLGALRALRYELEESGVKGQLRTKLERQLERATDVLEDPTPQNDGSARAHLLGFVRTVRSSMGDEISDRVGRGWIYDAERILERIHGPARHRGWAPTATSSGTASVKR